MSNCPTAAGSGGWRPPFTALQWQELEHQALIFKYLAAGMPVPPELLFPILKSFESMAARFYHHPTMGYCSLYGKKPDLEPWRCRRTDGKKWRCSKHAYPDSKYCERHMHRGRSRSRKPVETQNLSPSQPPTSSPSSTVTTLAPAGSDMGCGTGSSSSSSTRGFPSGIPLHSLGKGSGNSATHMSLSGTTLGQLQIGPDYCQPGGGNDRYLLGIKSTVDKHNPLSKASESAKGLGIDSSMDNTWHLFSAYPLIEPRNETHLQHSRLQSMAYFDHGSTSLQPRQQQEKHCIFGGEFDSRAAPMKQEGQPLLSFFDEWPNAKDSWSDLEDDKSNRTSLSTTQLSISMPVASSDFSTTNSRSPNAD